MFVWSPAPNYVNLVFWYTWQKANCNQALKVHVNTLYEMQISVLMVSNPNYA